MAIVSGLFFFRELFHPERVQSDISINIAPKFRREGIGTLALRELKPWLEKRGIDDVLAEIKIENDASRKIFENAGFNFIETGQHLILDTGKVSQVHRYLLSLTAKRKKGRIFIIAEAGSNWTNEGEAEKMIDTAVEAGADAVKFQTFRSDTLYVKGAGKSSYLAKAGYAEDIRDILKRSEMPYEMIPKLAKYCEEKGIEFMSSVFSEKDFEAVDPYVKRHKLASYEISHSHLIKLIAGSGKPLIMSTGCAEIEEIAWAVNLFREYGGKELTLLQCTAKYPASIASLNLQAIRSLEVLFKTSVGLSDHSQDPVVGPVAAAALGAKVIEKHFTLDRTLQGPDHAFSLEPAELQLMVRMIRKTEQALGSGIKAVLPEEEELYHYARRWLQATCDIAEGDVLRENENFAILRPGVKPRGAHPMHAAEIEGKRAKKFIGEGEGVAPQDVE